MRIIAYINWVFILLLLLVFIDSCEDISISGLGKSFNNNYFLEAHLAVDPIHDFKSSKLLYKFPNNNIPIDIDNFSFQLFDYLIVGESRKSKDPSFLKFYSKDTSLIKQSDEIEQPLSNTTFLLYINKDNLDIREGVLDNAYRILDSLTHFSDSDQGLVFELDLTSYDTSKLASSLKNLSGSLQEKINTNPEKRKNYKHLLSVTCTTANDLKKLESLNIPLPNYEGQLIKTFEHPAPENIIRGFNTLCEILEGENTSDLKGNTIFCLPKYPAIQYYGTRDTSSIIKIPNDRKTPEPNYTKQCTGKGDTFLPYKAYQKDTLYIAYEDQASLQSKLTLMAKKELSVGFWDTRNPHLKTNYKAQTHDGTIISLFRLGKGNLGNKLQKKFLKGESSITLKEFPINDLKNTKWWKPQAWYLQTIKAFKPKEKKPDYLLFLLTPFFAIKILLPLFILFCFSIGPNRNTVGSEFIYNLKVRLLGLKVTGNLYLWLNMLFWVIVFALFLFHYYKDGIGITTRNFAFLLLLFAALGPVFKFAWQIWKLAGKNLSKGFFKKAAKKLPYLSDAIYYGFAEEEKERINAHILTGGKPQNAGQTKKKPNPANTPFQIVKAYFLFKPPPQQGQGAQAQNQNVQAQGQNAQAQGQGAPAQNQNAQAQNVQLPGGKLKPRRGLLIFFQLLVVVFTVLGIYYGQLWHTSLPQLQFENMEFASIEKGISTFLGKIATGWDLTAFTVTILICLTEVAIIVAYFKDYYVYYLFKLFGNHV